MNATELLDKFEKELPNLGTWYWTEKTGSKPRILVCITKMLKAGLEEETVKDIIISMMYTGYVEHERQVKAETGLSVEKFMQKKLESLPVEQEHCLTNE
jgi:hypothetical protein